MAGSSLTAVAQFGDTRLPDRFWRKVFVAPSGCWIWMASRRSNGYGQFGENDGGRSAHRVAYRDLIGLVEGMDLDHLCRVRRCVNPMHLQPVSRKINVSRGLGLAAITVRTNTCQRGHSMVDAYIVPKTGYRSCRPCRRISKLRHIERIRAMADA